MKRESPVRHARALLLCAALLPLAARAADPVPQPAESAKERHDEAKALPSDAPRAADEHARSWEAAPVLETQVHGRELKEEERIGDYAQPRWTARRRFPTTRVYVVPGGAAQFEYWLETKTPFDNPGDTRFRSLYEMEFGLGHRLQLDLYLETLQQGPEQWHVSAEKAELRYAFADWGVLPGNPTLYLEWTRQSEGPHKGEVKLLLGDEIAPRWHWGANLVFERELGGASQGHEYALTGAVSYTVLDQKFSIGAEAQVELVDVRGHRFDFNGYEFLVGPSLQWRPLRQAHVDLVALFGVETERQDAESPFGTEALFEPTLVIGWEF